MNPNEPPLYTFHKSRLLTIILGLGFISCLWLAFGSPLDGPFRLILIIGAALFLVYVLYFEIQTLEVFSDWILIKYLSRKVRIDRPDIECVSLDSITSRGVRSRYVKIRLRSGKKVTIGNLRETAEDVYKALKACESRNEDFLSGR